MIRYRLDDLGWYQFEWLVQAVLKDHLGIGIESWGGHRDCGRDAWCLDPLHFPAKQSKSSGPFLFQAKFIENANAAGARPIPRLIAAVKAEMAEVLLRGIKNDGGRRNGKHYVLLTNSLISPEGRQAVESEVHKALPSSQVHCLGGNDICDLLDGNTTVRRSFPQLLSLRDLDILLANVVNRDIVERSSAAISYARDVAPVFVPTGAFVQAWDVLKKHHFAVLEGPPEMGKSAIAWMIALTQIASGWEASVCDTPDDFFRALRADASQIFIADDAFGRTEYDPARGVKWEAQLHRVFSRLGNAHWLVWTSRKHILERARKRMDLQGVASSFPQPGEVLVDASSLTVQDKALILYRHSKHSLPGLNSRKLIKHHSVQIVSDGAFTPERIRRFVTDVVPTLAEDISSQADAEALPAKITQEIQNPTDRMRKCFQALSLAHKWMLLSLLESEHYCTSEDLLSRYRSQYADDEAKPRDILEELTEAFVRIKGTTQRYVEWIHPSYRDLVIEQLRDGGSLKSEFLNRMNTAGIKLALSEAGGATGRLRFPLVNSAKDWDILEERSLHVARNSGTEHCTTLLTIVTEALDCSVGQDRTAVQRILKAICRILRERWDSDQVELDASAINAYAAASERASPMEPMPALEASWHAAVQRLQFQLGSDEVDFLFEVESLDEFLSVVEAIQNSEPRLLRRVNFPGGLDNEVEALLARVDRELNSDRFYTDKDGYDSEADASFSLAASLNRLDSLVSHLEKPVKSRIDKLNQNANRCRAKYADLESEEAEEEDSTRYKEYQARSEEPFNIEAVFVDL